MSDSLFSRSSKAPTFGKATEDVKVHLTPELKVEAMAAATSDGMTVSEYIRKLLILHLHGRLYMMRMTGFGGDGRGD